MKITVDPNFVAYQPVQRKLAICKSSNKYEQEKDGVIRQVNGLYAPEIQKTTRGDSLKRLEMTGEGESQTQPTIASLNRIDFPVESHLFPKNPEIIPLQRVEQDLKMKVIHSLNRYDMPTAMQVQPSVHHHIDGNLEGSADSESEIERGWGSGQPFEAGLQVRMGEVIGSDVNRVQVHTDGKAGQLNQSLQAKPLTIRQDVYFRQGTYQPKIREGQDLIANELIHVVQQNVGVEQADREKTTVFKKSDPDRVIQRKGGNFTPFSNGVKKADSLNGLVLDKLFEYGLQYTEGGTKGNSVNLEKMISDTGGGSAPGEPKDFTKIKQYDKDLVRAYNQSNAATAMHAVNHNFADPETTNLRPENIFMGSAISNTQEHFYKVEKPIRDSMQKLTKGNAKKYETNIKANPPQTLTNKPNFLAWNNASLDIPGAKMQSTSLSPPHSDPLPNVTHVLDTTNLKNEQDPWPKMIRYEVIPQYSYKAYPNLPKFLLDNIDDAQKLVDHANLTPPPRPNQQQINNEVWAIDRLKKIGHQLFPETFTCEAEYWFPSYDPAKPWSISSEKDVYDAEA